MSHTFLDITFSTKLYTGKISHTIRPIIALLAYYCDLALGLLLLSWPIIVTLHWGNSGTLGVIRAGKYTASFTLMGKREQT